MIDMLTGTVVSRDAAGVVLDVNGIGFRVEGSFTEADVGYVRDFYTVLTLTGQQEIKPRLFGFETQLERKLFVALRSVQGVGASTAARIAGARPVDEIVEGITEGDASVVRVKGVGAKIADRILADLGPKIGAVLAS